MKEVPCDWCNTPTSIENKGYGKGGQTFVLCDPCFKDGLENMVLS